VKKDSDADNRTTETPVAVPAYEDLSGQSLLVRARVRVVIAVLAWRNRRAERRLRAHAELWAHIAEYSRASAVAGASYSDYWTLYEQVRRHKPVEVLELGTGISTVVLAQALIDNQRDGAPPGRVTSVEDYPQWFEVAGESMPEALRGTVDLVLARKVEGLHRIFRGVRYDRLPEREYDFVFSDGPDRYSPVTGEKLFNLDLVEVIARSARYDVWRKLMFVGPVTRDDLRYLRRENFLPDLRLLGPTTLRLRLSRIGDSRDGEDRS
jgi:predicted O-methyltransferase YrrM